MASTLREFIANVRYIASLDRKSPARLGMDYCRHLSTLFSMKNHRRAAAKTNATMRRAMQRPSEEE